VATPPHIGLFGRSVFVGGSGVGGVPAACVALHPCSVATTVTSGRTVIATTGRERIGAGGGTLLYFKLSSAGQSLLAHAAGHRLAVNVSARDASGISASTNMVLVPFSTSGSGPPRAVSQGPALQLIGYTGFVASTSGIGGILAGCFSTNPCHIRTSITSGRTTLASTGPEFIGSGELGYLTFTLSSAGRSLLAHARGNQLAAHVVLRSGSTTASADVALVGFS
jgi:hypothetical protein